LFPKGGAIRELQRETSLIRMSAAVTNDTRRSIVLGKARSGTRLR
jgi:hypothetical protein